MLITDSIFGICYSLSHLFLLFCFALFCFLNTTSRPLSLYVQLYLDKMQILITAFHLLLSAYKRKTKTISSIFSHCSCFRSVFLPLSLGLVNWASHLPWEIRQCLKCEHFSYFLLKTHSVSSEIGLHPVGFWTWLLIAIACECWLWASFPSLYSVILN